MRKLAYRLVKNLKRQVSNYRWRTRAVVDVFGPDIQCSGLKLIKLRPGDSVSLASNSAIQANVGECIRREAYCNLHAVWYAEIRNGSIWTDLGNNIAVFDESMRLLGPLSFSFYRDGEGIYRHGKGSQNGFLTKGAGRNPKYLAGNVVALLSGGSGNTNYYHWHLDVLSRWAYIAQQITIDEVNHFIVPGIGQDFQKETLLRMGIPKEKLVCAIDLPFLRTDLLICISHPRTSTYAAPRDLVRLLFDALRYDKTLSSTEKDGIEKICLFRSEGARRRLLNQGEVRQLVENHGFKVIEMDGLSYREIVDIFHNAKMVIAQHGAALTNVLYNKGLKQVIELFPYHFVNPYYANLCEVMDIPYAFVRGLDDGSSMPNSRYEAQELDILVDITALNKILEESFL